MGKRKKTKQTLLFPGKFGRTGVSMYSAVLLLLGHFLASAILLIDLFSYSLPPSRFALLKK